MPVSAIRGIQRNRRLERRGELGLHRACSGNAREASRAPATTVSILQPAGCAGSAGTLRLPDGADSQSCARTGESRPVGNLLRATHEVLKIIEFARINTRPTVPRKKIEDLREAGARSLNTTASLTEDLFSLSASAT